MNTLSIRGVTASPVPRSGSANRACTISMRPPASHRRAAPGRVSVEPTTTGGSRSGSASRQASSVGPVSVIAPATMACNLGGWAPSPNMNASASHAASTANGSFVTGFQSSVSCCTRANARAASRSPSTG